MLSFLSWIATITLLCLRCTSTEAVLDSVRNKLAAVAEAIKDRAQAGAKALRDIRTNATDPEQKPRDKKSVFNTKTFAKASRRNKFKGRWSHAKKALVPATLLALSVPIITKTVRDRHAALEQRDYHALMNKVNGFFEKGQLLQAKNSLQNFEHGRKAIFPPLKVELNSRIHSLQLAIEESDMQNVAALRKQGKFKAALDILSGYENQAQASPRVKAVLEKEKWDTMMKRVSTLEQKGEYDEAIQVLTNAKDVVNSKRLSSITKKIITLKQAIEQDTWDAFSAEIRMLEQQHNFLGAKNRLAKIKAEASFAQSRKKQIDLMHERIEEGQWKDLMQQVTKLEDEGKYAQAKKQLNYAKASFNPEKVQVIVDKISDLEKAADKAEWAAFSAEVLKLEQKHNFVAAKKKLAKVKADSHISESRKKEIDTMYERVEETEWTEQMQKVTKLEEKRQYFAAKAMLAQLLDKQHLTEARKKELYQRQEAVEDTEWKAVMENASKFAQKGKYNEAIAVLQKAIPIVNRKHKQALDTKLEDFVQAREEGLWKALSSDAQQLQRKGDFFSAKAKLAEFKKKSNTPEFRKKQIDIMYARVEEAEWENLMQQVKKMEESGEFTEAEGALEKAKATVNPKRLPEISRRMAACQEKGGNRANEAWRTLLVQLKAIAPSRWPRRSAGDPKKTYQLLQQFEPQTKFLSKEAQDDFKRRMRDTTKANFKHIKQYLDRPDRLNTPQVLKVLQEFEPQALWLAESDRFEFIINFRPSEYCVKVENILENFDQLEKTTELQTEMNHLSSIKQEFEQIKVRCNFKTAEAWAIRMRIKENQLQREVDWSKSMKEATKLEQDGQFAEALEVLKRAQVYANRKRRPEIIARIASCKRKDGNSATEKWESLVQQLNEIAPSGWWGGSRGDPKKTYQLLKDFEPQSKLLSKENLKDFQQRMTRVCTENFKVLNKLFHRTDRRENPAKVLQFAKAFEPQANWLSENDRTQFLMGLHIVDFHLNANKVLQHFNQLKESEVDAALNHMKLLQGKMNQLERNFRWIRPNMWVKEMAEIEKVVQERKWKSVWTQLQTKVKDLENTNNYQKALSALLEFKPQAHWLLPADRSAFKMRLKEIRTVVRALQWKPQWEALLTKVNRLQAQGQSTQASKLLEDFEPYAKWLFADDRELFEKKIRPTKIARESIWLNNKARRILKEVDQLEKEKNLVEAFGLLESFRRDIELSPYSDAFTELQKKLAIKIQALEQTDGIADAFAYHSWHKVSTDVKRLVRTADLQSTVKAMTLLSEYNLKAPQSLPSTVEQQLEDRFTQVLKRVTQLKESTDAARFCTALLRIDVNADKRTVSKAYRKLALRAHPDKHRNRNTKVMGEYFAYITNAKEYLDEKFNSDNQDEDSS